MKCSNVIDLNNMKSKNNLIIMLEHQKMVLVNVDYNDDLFRKELQKSLVWLNSNDLINLRVWLKEKYWNTHREIIQEILYPYKVTA
jgi:hypothetical protein